MVYGYLIGCNRAAKFKERAKTLERGGPELGRVLSLLAIWLCSARNTVLSYVLSWNVASTSFDTGFLLGFKKIYVKCQAQHKLPTLIKYTNNLGRRKGFLP